jgi:anti-sigma B factor antagonist
MPVSLDPCPVRRSGGAAVIVLPTEIDVTNADQVGAELARALEADTEILLVDMTATEFCDSAAVQMLVRASQAATAAGVALRLAVGAHPVRRVLELTGADQVIDTYPDLDAAAHGPAATG